MTLYHGTNFEFNTVELSKCRPGTDFGKGFYLTPIKARAMERAKAKARAYGGEPIVTEWFFDESKISDICYLSFDKESLEWAKFVYKNRTEENYDNTFDVISGPVADDDLRMELNLVKRGILTLEDLAAKLVFEKPNLQYCFRTDKSLRYLRRI